MAGPSSTGTGIIPKLGFKAGGFCFVHDVFDWVCRFLENGFFQAIAGWSGGPVRWRISLARSRTRTRNSSIISAGMPKFMR